MKGSQSEPRDFCEDDCVCIVSSGIHKVPAQMGISGKSVPKLIRLSVISFGGCVSVSVTDGDFRVELGGKRELTCVLKAVGKLKLLEFKARHPRIFYRQKQDQLERAIRGD